jgi:RecJ-like exonuclease
MISKEMEDKINKFFSFGRCEYRENFKINLCAKCDGLGFYTTETLVDYHRNDYEYNTHNCNVCNGDGRIIVIEKSVVLNTSQEKEIVPYIGNENLLKQNKNTNIHLKVDNRNPFLENRHPELKELTYTNYDDMLRNILIEEALITDDKNTFPF